MEAEREEIAALSSLKVKGEQNEEWSPGGQEEERRLRATRLRATGGDGCTE